VELSGKRAVITGAANGIGLEIARSLVAEGASVLLFDSNRERLDQVAAELSGGASGIEGFVGSVADPGDVEAAFTKADKVFGGVDILVNNAGISGNCAALELSDERWNAVLGVDLNGVFYCSRAAGHRMVQQRSGSIINMASIYGIVAAPQRLAYCVAKSGVAMLTKVLASEWGPSGIRVNAIGPGHMDTPLLQELVAAGKLRLEDLIGRTPMRRLADTHDVAELAVFLASERSRNISGQVIAIDGGWTAYGYV